MPTTRWDAAVSPVLTDVVAAIPAGLLKLFDRILLEGRRGNHKHVHRTLPPKILCIGAPITAWRLITFSLALARNRPRHLQTGFATSGAVSRRLSLSCSSVPARMMRARRAGCGAVRDRWANESHEFRRPSEPVPVPRSPHRRVRVGSAIHSRSSRSGH